MENASTISAYIDAAASLHGLSLDSEQRQRVIESFSLTAAIAAPLMDYPLPAEIEAAPTFKA